MGDFFRGLSLFALGLGYYNFFASDFRLVIWYNFGMRLRAIMFAKQQERDLSEKGMYAAATTPSCGVLRGVEVCFGGSANE